MADEIDDSFSDQPLPETSANSAPVVTHAMAALSARAMHGERKYGVQLHTHNGRDALVDAAEEMMDGFMYICQAIMERDGRLPPRWFE